MLQKSGPYHRCQLCWSPLPDGWELCNFCRQYQKSAEPDLGQLLQRLEERLREGRQALEENLVKDGERIGWYHHLGEDGRTGISSSAYGVHALSLVNPDSPLITDIAQQIINDPYRHVAGSGDAMQIAWPMTHEPATPLVEPTCYVLQQLNLAGTLNPKTLEAQASLRWLLSQRRDQAWGPQRAMEPYVYVTALVCQVLSRFCPSAPELQVALHWLEKARNDDGGWGERPNDQHSRTWSTAHAALAFILGRGNIAKGNDVLGVKWLRENSIHWIEPYIVEYEFDIPPNQMRRGRASYRFDALPIVMLALLRSGLRPLAPDLLDGIHKLLEQQVEGVWIYPHSSQKTIFNLSHALQAVTEFRDSLRSSEMFVELYTQMTAIKEGRAEALAKAVEIITSPSKGVEQRAAQEAREKQELVDTVRQLKEESIERRAAEERRQQINTFLVRWVGGTLVIVGVVGAVSGWILARAIGIRFLTSAFSTWAVLLLLAALFISHKGEKSEHVKNSENFKRFLKFRKFILFIIPILWGLFTEMYGGDLRQIADKAVKWFN